MSMGELYRLDFSNGKSYIGITEKTAAERYKGHERSSRHGAKTFVHNAWRKHGAPKLVVLAVLEDRELLSTEIRAIKEFGTLHPAGYNNTEGGDFNPSKLAWVNEKRSAAMKGRPKSPEHMEKLRLANVGRAFTPEHIAALSKAAKGKPKSPEHRAKISAAQKGRVNSPESIEKMRAALTGRKNPAHSERMKGNLNWTFRKDKTQ